MSAIFFMKKEPPKRHNFFIYLKDRFFVMGGPYVMSFGVF